jgi:hypothetical protein
VIKLNRLVVGLNKKFIAVLKTEDFFLKKEKKERKKRKKGFTKIKK